MARECWGLARGGACEQPPCEQLGAAPQEQLLGADTPLLPVLLQDAVRGEFREVAKLLSDNGGKVYEVGGLGTSCLHLP